MTFFQVVAKPSRIPNAGLGLFAQQGIPDGEIISEYVGTKLSLKQLNRLYPPGLFATYVIQVNKDLYLDATHAMGCAARYANSLGRNSNCEFIREGKRIYLVSKWPIARGEEITADYGDEFVIPRR